MEKKEIKIQKIECLTLTMSLSYLQHKETKVWLAIDRNTVILEPIVKEIIDLQKKLIEKEEAEIKDGQLVFKTEEIGKEYADILNEEISLNIYLIDADKLSEEKLSPSSMRSISKYLINGD